MIQKSLTRKLFNKFWKLVEITHTQNWLKGGGGSNAIYNDAPNLIENFIFSAQKWEGGGALFILVKIIQKSFSRTDPLSSIQKVIVVFKQMFK